MINFANYFSPKYFVLLLQPGLSIDWCKQPDVGLPAPDLVCFLDVSEEVAVKRADFGGERYEVTDLQRRVRANYDLLRDQTWVMFLESYDSCYLSNSIKYFAILNTVTVDKSK